MEITWLYVHEITAGKAALLVALNIAKLGVKQPYCAFAKLTDNKTVSSNNILFMVVIIIRLFSD